VILDMNTYRYRGHSMSDPAQYRSKEEVADVKEHHDAIDYVRSFLIKNKYAKEERLKEIEKQIKDEISAAAEFSKNSPEPDASELYTDIYRVEE